MVKEENSYRYHPYGRTKKYVAGEPEDKESVVKRKVGHPARNDRLSVNELKRRIRDVKRVLKHADLPADAKAVQERALAAYEKDLMEEMDKRKRSDMIKKYHFVRFLDRKRATKELKGLLRQELQIAESDSATNAEDLATLSQQIHEARTNVNYTINFPLTEKYVSLYPSKIQDSAVDDELDCDNEKSRRSTRLRSHTHDGNDPKAKFRTSLGQQTSTKRAAQASSSFSRRSSSHGNGHESNNNNEKPSMWYTVEKSMANNTLGLLREGKLLPDAGTKTTQASVPAGTRTVRISSKTKTKATSNQTKNEVKQKRARKAVVRDHHHSSRYGEENDEESEESGFFEE